MTEKAFEQMMSGLKEAKDEYGRTVFPDCRSKYYAVRDAIELLKKQEAVKPKSKVRHGANAQIQHFCGNCNAMLHGKPNYCSNCGRKVKWE